MARQFLDTKETDKNYPFRVTLADRGVETANFSFDLPVPEVYQFGEITPPTLKVSHITLNFKPEVYDRKESDGKPVVRAKSVKLEIEHHKDLNSWQVLDHVISVLTDIKHTALEKKYGY